MLRGKTIYAFGDSVVYGHSAPDKCFLRILAEEDGMDLSMFAVNGATIISIDSAKEVETERAEGNYIIKQIPEAPDRLPDVIIFNGGTNDTYGSSNPADEHYDGRFNPAGTRTNLYDHIGAIQGPDGKSFDNSTFCGGFEAILRLMRERWQNTPIVYVAIQKSGGRSWEAQLKVRELSLEICRRWGVYVADLFRDSALDTRDPAQMAKYIINGSGSHPNELACREFYVPLVRGKLLEIFGE